MKKKFYLFFPIILLIFINGCGGYKPIFGSSNLQFEIANYSIEGDKILGKRIYSKLYNLTKSAKEYENIKKIDLLINVSKSKNSTVKNSAGKILEYKITLNTKIIIKDYINGNNILKQNFSSSLSYNVQDQYSDTVKLENKIIETMLNNTYQDLLIKLSQSIETK